MEGGILPDQCQTASCFSNAIFRRVEQQFNKIPTDVVGLSRSIL